MIKCKEFSSPDYFNDWTKKENITKEDIVKLYISPDYNKRYNIIVFYEKKEKSPFRPRIQEEYNKVMSALHLPALEIEGDPMFTEPYYQ